MRGSLSSYPSARRGGGVLKGPLLSVREGGQGGRALNAGDGADLGAENRRHVDEVGYVDLDDDVVGPHDFMDLFDTGNLAECIEDPLGGTGVGDHQHVSLYHVHFASLPNPIAL